MPKLWNETIDEHRRAVRSAAIDATAALVAEHGLRAVTMAAIAAETGIGRATLYKYFADVEAILLAWHERQLAAHMSLLIQARDAATDPVERLSAVLAAFASIQREGHRDRDSELAAFLHRDEHVGEARRQLRRMVRELIRDAVEVGAVREDVPAEELAAYSLHALSAAGRLPSRAAVQRLVEVTLAGLRAPSRAQVRSEAPRRAAVGAAPGTPSPRRTRRPRAGPAASATR